MKENLYFKLTTVPDFSEKALELYFKKYKETNSLESVTQAEEDFYQNGGKNPLFGKIYSITVGYVNGDEIRTTVLKGSEKDILTEFLNLCNSEHFKNYQICGWNFSFLLSFLRVRAKKNEVTVPFNKDLEDLGKKHWTITGLDLFDNWKGMGWFSSSLEEVAELTFNLTTDFVDGEDVFKYYKEGDYKRLDESSNSEIATLINVHRLIKGQSTIESVNSSVKELEKVEEVELPLLESIYKVVSIDSATKDKIQEKLFKKKLTKKDKLILEDLLTSLYINNAMFQSDSPQIKERKKQEIKEILDATA